MGSMNFIRSIVAVTLVWGAASAAPALAQSVGSYGEGQAFGSRNGTTMVSRVRARTLDLSGCSALDDLQEALLAATRAVRPSGGSGEAFVRGFYAGYREALFEGIERAREQCESRRFSSGSYHGQLQGALFCNLVDAGAVPTTEGFDGYDYAPIYEDWSDGASARRECRAAFSREARACVESSLRPIVKAAKKETCR